MHTHTVHILEGGRARCGMPGVPGDWPKGHKWVSLTDSETLPEANCRGCLGDTANDYAVVSPQVYSVQEREVMLARMRVASNAFYRAATAIGCHPFIEFCGLMNEYIAICEGAHGSGIDFTQANAHSGEALPMLPHHAAYVGEKLGCIYGPSLQGPANLMAFLRAAGLAGPMLSELERKRAGQ